MKILMLNGSPRPGGNTACALERLKTLLEKEHTVELLDICGLRLSPCIACNACKQNGGHCVQPDDSDTVIRKVAGADVVIFGTPVYWWGISAQLKMVVDKFYSCRPELQTMKKKVGLLSVGSNETDNLQYWLIGRQFACIAKYLNWELAFTTAFSASAAGEVLQDPTLPEKLRQAADSL